MGLIPVIKLNDPVSTRQAIQKLALKLGPASEPTFAGLTLTGFTASRLIATDANKAFESTDIDAWIAGTTNQVIVTDDNDGSITLSLPQDIHTGADPTFNDITAGRTFLGTAGVPNPKTKPIYSFVDDVSRTGMW